MRTLHIPHFLNSYLWIGKGGAVQDASMYLKTAALMEKTPFRGLSATKQILEESIFPMVAVRWTEHDGGTQGQFATALPSEEEKGTANRAAVNFIWMLVDAPQSSYLDSG
jgi:hypothetical protein